MQYEHLNLERDGTVLVIHLNRPPVNALSRAMQEELRRAAVAAGTDQSVRAVVVAGSDKAFAAGGDIREMAGMEGSRMVSEAPLIQSAFAEVARIPVPTVAAISGVALGGGFELALCCDRRIAARDARLGLPEVTLGIIPGAGGTQRLTRLVGPARAKEICFSGRAIDAKSALEWGIVDEVAEHDVLADAMTWAHRMSEGAPLVLRALKTAIDQGLEMDLEAALDLESSLLAEVFASRDRERGMTSFVERGPGRATFEGN